MSFPPLKMGVVEGFNHLSNVREMESKFEDETMTNKDQNTTNRNESSSDFFKGTLREESWNDQGL